MPNPEEYRRTRRIVDILLRIANQPRRWTRKELAEQYEVSEKQMDKDLYLIRHGLRMPLRHVAEGYYFERLTALPTLSLTLSEALSLLLAARLGQQMPGVSRSDLAAAIARVESLLPLELIPLVGALGRADEGSGARGATLRELQLAIAERARLRLRYRSASHICSSLEETGTRGRGDGETGRFGRGDAGTGRRGDSGTGRSGDAGTGRSGDRQQASAYNAQHPALSTQYPALSTQDSGLGTIKGLSTQNPGPGTQDSERVVDPYTLLPYLKSWYLIGLCHLRHEVRTFKVDRIQAVARIGESFELPEGFDLAGYMGHTWGLLRGEAGEPEDVVLEFTPEAGRWVRDEEWHPGQRVEDLPDGRVRLIFHVGITSEMRRWVLGFGRQVRVMRPASLAEWVREEIKVMLEEHRK